MLDLIIKNICENTSRINKLNKRNCFMFILITANIYVMTKKIESNEKEIKNLKEEIEEMKSKGE